MSELSSMLDPYEWRARQIPGFLAVLPVPVFCIVTGLRDRPTVSALAALFTAGGGAIVLAGLARSKGLKLQPRLWSEWGGTPTTDLLRLSSNEKSTLCQQRRSRVEQIAGFTLPTIEDERLDPARADDTYNAAIREVIRHTRDRTRYPLIFKENQNYGYWRNLLGVRPLGITFATAGILCSTGAIATKLLWKFGPEPGDMVTGLVVMIGILGFWAFYPTNERVHQAADAYAERLLDSAVPINAKAKNKKKGG